MQTKQRILTGILVLVLLLPGCGYRPEEAPARETPAATAEVTVTPEPTAEPTPTPTPSPSPTPEPTPTPDPEEVLWEQFEAAFGKDRQQIAAEALDGFLWLDGFLYTLGEDGRFLRDGTCNNLYFGQDGRYTCGNEQLDALVAQQIDTYLKENLTEETVRMDLLHGLYYHIKNDFAYLTRNYYDSGAEGWDTDEAITFFTTGKSNCYGYAGAFCAICRGLGYDARTWSGSMGAENQPHAWTEITMQDDVYILDPELEMNYWYLDMYWDFFMIPKSNSAAYNYLAAGRDF